MNFWSTSRVPEKSHLTIPQIQVGLDLQSVAENAKVRRGGGDPMTFMACLGQGRQTREDTNKLRNESGAHGLCISKYNIYI